MKLLALLSLSGVLLEGAQAPSATVRPRLTAAEVGSSTSEERTHVVGAPVMGYVLGGGPTVIRPIFAASSGAKLGDALPVPTESVRLYLPPRQQYALMEVNNDSALELWALHREVVSGLEQKPVALNGAIAHPDIVSFSPRGDAAVLYSEANSSLQVVSHLPLEPSVSKPLTISSHQNVSHLAISDDSLAVVIQLADKSVMVSLQGGAPKVMHLPYSPDTWSFVPKSHDLVLTDIKQNVIVRVPDINDSSKSSKIIAQGVPADEIVLSKDGQELVAANMATGQLWKVDLKTGAVVSKTGISTTGKTSLLRDGFTVVLSSSPSLSLWTLGNTEDGHIPIQDSAAGITTGK